MTAVARIGDTVVGYCNGPNHKKNKEFTGVWITGSETVFADHLGVVRLNDTGVTDCGHTFIATSAAQNVNADNLGVHRVGDTVLTEGGGVGVTVTGSETVLACDVTGTMSSVSTVDAAIDGVMMTGDDLDDGTPAGKAAAAEHLKKHIDSGLIKKEDLEKPAVEGEKDETPPEQSEVTGDCSGLDSVSSFPDSYQLTSTYTLGQIRRGAVGAYPIGPNMGKTAAQIVCNLKMITINCWTPIKAHYPNAFITSSFRANSGGSQHNIGQALDMQFSGIPKAGYYTIAQWIKANVTFDQLLLEYKTTGTGMPWIHVSFKQSGNRGQVLTFMNNRAHSQGLVDLSKS